VRSTRSACQTWRRSASVRLHQGELEHGEDARALAFAHRFLGPIDLERAEHLLVAGVRRLGALSGEQIAIGLADDGTLGQQEELLVGAVHHQVAAVHELDVNRGGHVVQYTLDAGSELAPLVRQFDVQHQHQRDKRELGRVRAVQDAQIDEEVADVAADDHREAGRECGRPAAFPA